MPHVSKLRSRWVRPDDVGLYNPQQEIDDLWADIIHLEWHVAPCPELPTVGPLSILCNSPGHKSLWRAFHAALSQAEDIARSHASQRARMQHGSPEVGENPSCDEAGYPDPTGQSARPDRGLVGPFNCHKPIYADAAGAAKSSRGSAIEDQPNRFSGGEIAFLPDRIELCGICICSGPRSRTRRLVLDLLRKKGDSGAFVAYSGDELAQQLELNSLQGSPSGIIRDLRDDIIEALRSHANLAYGRGDVILSRGPGYRFSDCITVQDGGTGDIGDTMDTAGSRDVPNSPTPDVLNVRDVPNPEAKGRRLWVLEQLHQGIRVKAPDIVKQFKCSKKTAHRDLLALKNQGKIEFVGAARTGAYRVRTAATPAND